MESKLQQQMTQQDQVNKPNLTGIPTQMKLDFEQRSGLSFDDVRVHYNSDKPARLQALAYTQGTQVYVGPGQERHLKHELGHVVQQKLGMVSTSILYYGHTSVNINPQLEQQADELSKVSIDDQNRNISSPIGAHRPIIQFKLDDYFTDNGQKIAYILSLLSQITENCCPKIKESVLTIQKNNESKAMLYVWGKENADRFLEEIIKQISKIKHAVLSENSTLQYYVEYIKLNLRMHKKEGVDVEIKSLTEWVDMEIESLIEDLKDRVKCCQDCLTSQKKSANDVYQQSYDNKYESIRGKNLKGGQKKIFLRRLSRDGQALSDISADAKIQQSTHNLPSSDQRPYLRAQVWSTIINDAFVGGAIDGHSRFDIRSLPYDLWEKLENLTSSSISSVERATTFLEKICTKYPEVYNENNTYTYTVLAREIAQLLYHGWIFRIIKIGKKPTLQAFASKTLFSRYQKDKKAKHNLGALRNPKPLALQQVQRKKRYRYKVFTEDASKLVHL